ncbi:phage tail protein [Escherichia coli]|nr:phage tail protein [Escherichia coli]EIP7786083.1 phage tail protein [Escherichia coli]
MEDCTVPEPEVFNWIPREGMETTRKPSVITVKFGDGYEQRRAGGLNADLKTFKPVFRVTDEYSRAALDSFLSRHAGIRAFLWRPPKQNRTVRVVCREWSISDNAMYTDFNCTFEEVTH